MNQAIIKEKMNDYCKMTFAKSLAQVGKREVFEALSSVLMGSLVEDWQETTKAYEKGKMAYYISAEYLMGRALGNNLLSLGVQKEVKALLEEMGISMNALEEAQEDAGLGNGGLGRLAACFMDSAAAMEIPLVGYGIRYSNGLFTQKIVDGAQEEEVDEWLQTKDPWSIRQEELGVTVDFADFSVKAVPYDMPIIGYQTKNINTLRLWKSEPFSSFDFKLYNEGFYKKAHRRVNQIEDLSRVLYPNDQTEEGKKLRLRQQYFMVSATLQDILRTHKRTNKPWDTFSEYHAVQLNDTHPVLAIPELMRLLMREAQMVFEEALGVCEKVFGYTNHTILAEALEKWDVDLMEDLFPEIVAIIAQMDRAYSKRLKEKGLSQKERDDFKIIKNETVHMANLAIHVSHAVNGVAALHTQILKEQELKAWHEIYPNKFQNKTNGITPRRWIALCNPELSAYITSLLGSDGWVKDLSQLKRLEAYIEDEKVLQTIMELKQTKKKQLAHYIEKEEGIVIDPDSLFDIQVKRLHEYKRQLLNAFYILDLYYRIKADKNCVVPKCTFIFGAKAFPGYQRAKAIIRYIGEVAKKINQDEEVNDRLKVVFVQNYRVSYGEKLFPAADLSKQISTAGKEASGTGNMKFMLNGAPTFGTYDGANVEIVRESGEENNFIFGLRVEDIERLKGSYNPKEYYEKDEPLQRVVDSLIDGTFSDKGSGEFKDLYDSLLKEGDVYFTLADFQAFKEKQEEVFEAYQDQKAWAKMCLMNIANSGIFSSDRTIMEYAKDIWHINSIKIE